MGIVICSTLPINITTTTSSKEVINANKAPEITPGRINGIITLKKVRNVSAPKLCDALIKFVSKPVKVAVTVITTNGVPRAVCAKIIPILMSQLQKNIIVTSIGHFLVHSMTMILPAILIGKSFWPSIKV